MKTRVLGIDFGTARVGLAITDPLGITAQPMATLTRTSDRQICRQIAAIVADSGVGEVVVGLPLAMTGEAGEAAKRVQEFVRLLERYIRVPVTLWDERLTTVEAERALQESGVSPSRRQQLVDQVAASLMLQAVLASRTAGPAPGEGDR